jgi:hypothetical protein
MKVYIFFESVLLLIFSTFAINELHAQDFPFPGKQEIARAKVGELILNSDSLN